jgi:hypothetical protein
MDVRRRLADLVLTVLADTLADLTGLWEEIHTDPETGRLAGALARHQAHRKFPAPYRRRGAVDHVVPRHVHARPGE